jgi:hypothetical protein
MSRLIPLLAVALLLAGCGTGKKSAEQAGSTSSEPTTTLPACVPLAGATTSARVSPAVESRETMYLTDVTAETQRCGDRVVFDFAKAGPPGPGYNVSYEPEASAKLEDASGKPIAIAGSAFLVVRLTPAMTARISGEKVEPTYTGPRRITTEGFSFVREVVKTGDFEAVVTWVIGLEEKRPFSATASSTRLVVELG